MVIEDYWLDGTAYHVEFIVNDGQCIDREIIVPLGMSEDAIRKLIESSFNNVKKISALDYMNDVLCTKKFPEIVIM
ncbi:hypothetical protein [Carnobacterium divergens]|uniref:hypothetical protein n=1 Tax=Carnobacterium divergens TaxID=2748 RepID=UPI00288E5292|nr:hypothetical protein [Carnobacterium divergens]MDT2012588.1 hypothetical protein [Carnobacterium divergens]